jgi:serine/threonine protein kinase
MIKKRSTHTCFGAGGAIVFDEVTSKPWVASRLEQYGETVMGQLSQSSVPRIPLSDIVRTVSVLGKGSFSKVYKVEIRSSVKSSQSSSNIRPFDNCDCYQNDYQEDQQQQLQYYDKSNNAECFHALKCLNPKRMTSEDVFLTATADLAYEIAILSQSDHQNIIRLEGVASGDFATSFSSSTATTAIPTSVSSFASSASRCGYYMLLEILTETLETRLCRWRGLKKRAAVLPFAGHHFGGSRTRRRVEDVWEMSLYENRIPNVMQGLAEAIHYLHRKKIVVRDLKPANIGFTPQGVVKLFDFGFARHVDDCQDGEIAGSYRYMAPENMTGMKSNLTSDVYTFGVLLFEVATLHEPYDELLQNSQSEQSLNDVQAKLAQKLSIHDGGMGWRMKTNEIQCSRTRSLIERCWNPHPESRPDFESICLEMEAICGAADTGIDGTCTMGLLELSPQPPAPLISRLSRTLSGLSGGGSRRRLIRQVSDPIPLSRVGNSSPRAPSTIEDGSKTRRDGWKKYKFGRIFALFQQDKNMEHCDSSTEFVCLP